MPFGRKTDCDRESVDVAFGDVAFQICENWVFKEKNVRLNSAGCEPHSRSDECFLFENPIFTLLKRHVRKRHVYRLPITVLAKPHLAAFCFFLNSCLRFSACACHPCAGAVLIFSVSFRFQRMIPEGNPTRLSTAYEGC